MHLQQEGELGVPEGHMAGPAPLLLDEGHDDQAQRGQAFVDG